MAFPQRALVLAATRRLGEPIRAYDARIGARRALVWLVLFGTVGGLLVPATVIYLRDGRLAIGIVGGLLAVGHLGAAVRILVTGGLRGWGQAAFLFESGFVRLTRSGRTAFHWDDLSSVTVAGLQRSPGRGTRWRFTVVSWRGRQVTLGSALPGVRELGETIVAEVTSRLVPRHLATIEAGDPVELGPFTVSQAGIQKDGEAVLWPAVREVGISNGVVYVRRIDDLHVMAVTAGQMPNAVVFAALCDRVRAGGAPESVRSRRRIPRPP